MNISDLTDLGEKCKLDTVDEAGGLFPPSRYYAFFKRLAAFHKPKLSVVLGVCGGGDCYHLCQGYGNSVENHVLVVGVDIVLDHPEQIAYIKDKCWNFKFWEGDSVECAPVIAKAYGMANFLFIDTTHFQDQTVAEWEAWKPYLAPGAVVAFDDIFRPGMEEFWETLPEPKVRMDFLHDGTYPHGGGFGCLIMPSGYAEAVKAPDYEMGN